MPISSFHLLQKVKAIMPPKNQSPPALPPGIEAHYSVTCKDVVMGRGSGTQNHCGNVTYRKLVYLNKELYATSSKFDKLKISKAIVAAVREFGGSFVQADDKRGGLYYDIGDKRAWDKTSQALREGQAEIRARLAEEDPNGMSKTAEYKQVISEQTFFTYACKMLESLYHPLGDSGISACGQMCPHAKRRQTLHHLGANPMMIQSAMQSLAPPPLPPPQSFSPQQQQQGYAHVNMQQQQAQPYQLPLGGGANNMNNQITPTSSMQPPFQGNMGATLQPPPFNAPSSAHIGSFEPLPYVSSNSSAIPGGSAATAPTYNSYPSSLSSVPTSYEGNTLEPLPYQDQTIGLQKLAKLSPRTSSGSTVFSLRRFCSEDCEMTSEEGKALMEQLNNEVDDLIRRKSYGLIEIDTTQAFEDLVYEDDSMAMDDGNGTEDIDPPAHARETSTSSSSGRHSGMSKNSSRGSGMSRGSGLSFKDDMSLMNMSILTLDENGKDKDEESSPETSPIEVERSTSKDEKETPKSIMKLSDPSESKNIKRRDTRVSFAGKGKNGMNVSLMSMDDQSFINLVDYISDPDGGAQERGVSDISSDSLQMSRKIGFPMRQGVAEKYGASGPPNSEVGQKEDQPNEKVSSLPITEDPFPPNEKPAFPLRSTDFTAIAGTVENPAGVSNSLKLDMSLSNISALDMNGMSSVSLLGEIDPDLLE